MRRSRAICGNTLAARVARELARSHLSARRNIRFEFVNAARRSIGNRRMSKKVDSQTDSTIALSCPISHVPVAACRSVGSGQEAGQPPTEAESYFFGEPLTSLLGVRWDADVIDSRRRNRRTPRSTGDAA